MRKGLISTLPAYFTLAVCGLMLLLILLFPLRTNGDVGIFLEVGHRIIEGQLPYIDFQEINLPTIMYMKIPVIALSEVIGVNSIFVFNLALLLTIFYCISVIYWVLQKNSKVLLELNSFTLPLIVLLVSLRLLEDTTAGEREHLIALLFLPWFFLRWHRWRGGGAAPTIAFIVGFLACLSASIKPFFIPIFVVGEIYWLIKYRKKIKSSLLTYEILGGIAFVIVYAGYFLFNPQVLENYLEYTVPLAQTGYGSWGNIPLVQIFAYGVVFDGILIHILIGVAPLFFRSTRTNELWSLISVLNWITLAAYFGMALQRKGWDYHYIPQHTLLWMLLVLTAYTLVIEIKHRPALRQLNYLTKRLKEQLI